MYVSAFKNTSINNVLYGKLPKIILILPWIISRKQATVVSFGGGGVGTED